MSKNINNSQSEKQERGYQPKAPKTKPVPPTGGKTNIQSGGTKKNG